ncbi:MAG: type II toxin-antitoxin system VapC family toxin [Vicinamibacterales bacterium]
MKTSIDPPAGGAAFRYIETSALLAARLENDRSALQAIRGEGVRVASALTIAEANRSIVRTYAAGKITTAEYRATLRWIRRFEKRCEIVAISPDVLARVARPFVVEPLRTLDAIHLATAELIDEQPQLVTIVTRDRRIRENAIALGFMVE